MKKLYNRLKYDIEQELGIPIKNHGDVKYLFENISSKQENVVSYNTLRRFYEFLPWRKPQIKTLNSLSNFIGYPSFNSYQKFINKDLQWGKWVLVNNFENINEISAKDLESFVALKADPKYALYLSAVIKSYIRRKKFELVQVIFQEDQILIEDSLEEASKVAYSVATTLQGLTKNDIKLMLKILKGDTKFCQSILRLYVDYSNLNGYYGYILNGLNNYQQGDADAVFTNLLLNYHRYLNGENDLVEYAPSLDQLELSPLLLGRYCGYQLLYKFNYYPEQLDDYWNQIMSISKTTNPKAFFLEITPVVLFVKYYKGLKNMIKIYYEDLFEVNNWSDYVSECFYLIAYGFLNLKEEEYYFTKINLDFVDLEKLKHDSHFEFISLFYNLLHYQLEQSTTNNEEVLKSIENKYNSLVISTGFKRFSSEFLNHKW